MAGSVCAAQDSCNSNDHCYASAKVKTVSGKEVTLKSVSVYVDAEKIHYYSYQHSEIAFVSYRHRTSLGPEFEGKAESIELYRGDKPVSFKQIEFAAGGEPQAIEFQGHAALSSKDVILTFPGDPAYSSDQWLFYGTATDGGSAQDISIRGSKIQSITFEGAPPQKPFDKR